jgi:hydroxyacyl-ACP dehydratase HTD2-like protein with hotdog domain
MTSPSEQTPAGRHALVGRTGAPFTVVVEEGKVREFAQVSRARDMAGYADADATAPATYLAVANHWRDETANPWHGVERDWKRVLHGEQEFVFHTAPPRVGDRLTATAVITDVVTKQGKRGGEMVFITVTTTFERDREVVAEMRTTSIEVQRAASGDG